MTYNGINISHSVITLRGSTNHDVYFTKCLVGGQHTMKKLTQSDLRFFQNERSKRYNNNEKRGHQDGKSRRNMVKMIKKRTDFGKKNYANVRSNYLWNYIR